MRYQTVNSLCYLARRLHGKWGGPARDRKEFQEGIDMEGETLEQVELRSDGISGDGDADRLETDIAAIDGVRDVEVDTDSHTVSVSYDPRQVSYPKIRQAVETA